jgi:hypothetical protein
VFLDVDGNVVLETPTDAVGEATYTSLNSDPVHVALLPGEEDEVFVYGYVPIGANIVVGEPFFGFSTPYTLTFEESFEGDSAAASQRVSQWCNQTGTGSFQTSVDITSGACVSADGSVDAYAHVLDSGGEIIASSVLQDFIPTQDAVFDMPPWSVDIDLAQFTVLGTADTAIPIVRGWLDEFYFGVVTGTNLAPDVPWTNPIPTTLTSMELSVQATTGGSVSVLAIGLDDARNALVMDMDTEFLVPANGALFDVATYNLTWTNPAPDQEVDYFEASISQGRSTINLYLSGDAAGDESFTIPTLPANIADSLPTVGGGDSRIRIDQIDYEPNVQDRQPGSSELPLAPGERRRTALTNGR